MCELTTTELEESDEAAVDSGADDRLQEELDWQCYRHYGLSADR